MLVAGGSMAEYNELLSLSIEDYLIRFKMFIEDLQAKYDRAKEASKRR